MVRHLVALMALAPSDVPNPGAGTAPPGFEKFQTIMGWGKWVALGVLVMALIFAGVRMGFSQHRGEGGEHAAAIGWVLGGVMLVSAAFTIVGFLAV